MQIFLILLLVFATQSVQAAGRNFDDCILESMKGVSSDFAAETIARSCRKKFPPQVAKECEKNNLKLEELKRIKGIGGYTSTGSSYLQLWFHNQNDFAVYELAAAVWSKIEKAKVEKEYNEEKERLAQSKEPEDKKQTRLAEALMKVQKVEKFYKINSTLEPLAVTEVILRIIRPSNDNSDMAMSVNWGNKCVQ